MQLDQLKRREFISLLGGVAAWPLATHAQQPPMPVIGFLSSSNSSFYESAGLTAAFYRGLSKAGLVERQSYTIAFRWADARNERLAAMAAELVAQQVAVLVAAGGPPIVAAKATTTSIPIVFLTAGDPVTTGLVTSLNRPGGNLTGFTLLSVELAAKKLQLLHELIPTATNIGLLVNPTNPNAAIQSDELTTAATSLGLRLHILTAANEGDFDTVFATLVQLRTSALLIGTDSLFNSRSEHLAALALRHAVPAIYQYPEFVASGGLMSYGASLKDSFQDMGFYAGRILKGEKPADLPVQQITKVELIINLKTAKALGLTVPLSLLGRADEVIE
jgi:putative tryptophan/tyrosine transport system substrate-binding protein